MQADLDPVAVDADRVGEARVAGVGPGLAEVGADRGPRLRGSERERVLRDAALVDVLAGGAQVGAAQGGAVGEGVEALALEVRRRGVDHQRHDHRDQDGEADDEDRGLAAFIPRVRIVDLLVLADRDRVRRVEGEARRPTAEHVRQQRQVDPGGDPDGDHRGALVAVVGVRRAADGHGERSAAQPLVGQRLPGRLLGTRLPQRVVRRQRVGPAGRAGRAADAEGALLHLEDAEHDPQHRDQQQHAEPGQLDQRAPPLVPSHRLLRH